MGAEHAISVGHPRDRGRVVAVRELAGDPVVALAGRLRKVRAANKDDAAWWSAATFTGNRRRRDAWAASSAVVLDVDTVDHVTAERADTEAALRVLRALEPAPSLLVPTHSGGVRVVWVLGAPTRDADDWATAADGAVQRGERALVAAGLWDRFRVDRGASTDLVRLWWAAPDGVPVEVVGGVVSLAALAPRPAEIPADDAADFGEAVAQWNAEHPVDWPRSGGSCPACGHNGCFGVFPDTPGRWACFSANHAGVGLRGAGCWHGDALDLEAHARGVSRADVLRTDGCLGDGTARAASTPATMPATPRDAATLQPSDGTDLAIAQRFAAAHAERHRCTEAGEWLAFEPAAGWQRGMAARDAALGRIAEAARGITMAGVTTHNKKLLAAGLRQETRSHLEGALALAAAQPGVRIAAAELDRDPWLLGVRNGVLDLRTAELRGWRAADLVTRRAGVAWDPGATCPIWERCIDEWTAAADGTPRPDVAEHLQRWDGYACTGSVREHALLLCHGTGRNGKGTHDGTMLAVLGDYAAPAPPRLLLARRGEHHPTEREVLRGRRYIAVSEVPSHAVWDVESIKSLTGGDRLQSRGMRQDFSAFEPTHKLVVALNTLPRSDDLSPAFWSRVRLQPWDRSYTGRENRKLAEKLRAELPGILRWCVDGCRAWLGAGLPRVAAIEERTAEYREAQDHVAKFLDEATVKVADASARANAVYLAYRAWCATVGETPLSPREFPDALRSRGYEDARDKVGKFWRGLGLLAEALPAEMRQRERADHA